jgi:hypothetical protein
MRCSAGQGRCVTTSISACWRMRRLRMTQGHHRPLPLRRHRLHARRPRLRLRPARRHCLPRRRRCLGPTSSSGRGRQRPRRFKTDCRRGASRRPPRTEGAAEFVDLWAHLRETHLTQGIANRVQWRLAASGAYSARSAYKLFFIGRSEVSGMRELWSSGAPLKHKLHMWLALKDRLWTADRLRERGM